MDFKDLRLRELGIDTSKLGRIVTFVDFGNVNKWFSEDVWRPDGTLMSENEQLMINIENLSSFIDQFSSKKFFYYGIDPSNPGSLHIKVLAERFGFRYVTKTIQWIKHHLPLEEKDAYQTVYKKGIGRDDKGIYINIPKCNFDVELCLDAMRLIDEYDTICLFSSDSDFHLLLKYLRKMGKKVILIKGGHISSHLKSCADILINAQRIKSDIVSVKQKKPTGDSRKQKGLYLSKAQISDPSPRAGQVKLAKEA
ncbi:MAG: NYN domain-containing protein [Candidatus Altimarinota bacterium]